MRFVVVMSQNVKRFKGCDYFWGTVSASGSKIKPFVSVFHTLDIIERGKPEIIWSLTANYDSFKNHALK